MAIGKRIVERLVELGWKRNDLLEEVEGLSAQTLSQLITRDSARSEWDEPIAKALGISVLDLVYGKKITYSNSGNITPIRAEEPDCPSSPVRELLAIVDTMTERGIYELIGQARLLASLHPAAKPNLAQ